MSFESLSIDKHFVRKLNEGGITTPAPVQLLTIPKVMSGKDVVVESLTGSGKTLAYLLPILQGLDASSKSTQAIVLVPTRELGIQIVRVAEQLMQGSSLSVQSLIGGAAIGRQIDRLRLKPQLVVGTPGRVLELIKIRKLNVHHVRTIVIDEVDQVFALGSVSEVDAIMHNTQRERQVLFFSATIPDSVTSLVERWMKEPEWIRVNPKQRTSETIEHMYFVCESREKLDVLRRIVRSFNPPAAIVFMNKADKMDEMVSKMKHIGLSVEAISADSGKLERAKVMNAFRESRFQLLLATDVAARGLDIRDVTHIIHLDPPIEIDQYIHRVGRTGRMGRKGIAISIVEPKEVFIIEKFAKNLGIDITPKAMSHGEVIEADRLGGMRAGDGRRGRLAPASNMVTRPAGAGRSSSNTGRPGKSGSGSNAIGPASGARKSERSTARNVSGTEREQLVGLSMISSDRPAPADDKRKARTDRHRDRKNKGAPKWLKDKRRQ